MRKEIAVIYDDSMPDKIMIGKQEHDGDSPWEDLAYLLEGVGLLANLCFKNGITHHNDQTLPDYLKSYIDKVFADYNTTYEEKDGSSVKQS